MVKQHETDRAYLRPDELETVLGVGRRTIYKGLQAGEIPAIRLGRRFVIPRAAVDEWLRRAGSIGK